ncbi:hypothetical protein BJY04DRAFT_73073 [Aspergillus karnatakaensis]|uniref:uncharacterized protein n=1 Tax=Aspergillus karnatakaensis TaxID=1810916 RepID=UPI003CCDBF48
MLEKLESGELRPSPLIPRELVPCRLPLIARKGVGSVSMLPSQYPLPASTLAVPINQRCVMMTLHTGWYRGSELLRKVHQEILFTFTSLRRGFLFLSSHFYRALACSADLFNLLLLLFMIFDPSPTVVTIYIHLSTSSV